MTDSGHCLKLCMGSGVDRNAPDVTSASVPPLFLLRSPDGEVIRREFSTGSSFVAKKVPMWVLLCGHGAWAAGDPPLPFAAAHESPPKSAVSWSTRWISCAPKGGEGWDVP